MSRIGLMPVTVPNGVTVSVKDQTVTITGPKGTLSVPVPHEISVTVNGNSVSVGNHGKSTRAKALHGLIRSLFANSVTGVTVGWTKTLELVGVGYRAALTGANLTLNLGFSHPVEIKPPQGITFTITDGKIIVSGIDKQLVGQVASDIREVKKPEPYKGKGIRYQGEHVRKKAGKAKAVGGAPGK